MSADITGLTVMNEALALVREHGWYVFRLHIGHSVKKCNGGVASCKTVRTLTENGIPEEWSSTASNDPDVIESWDWTHANAYGIDCGRSGLVVVDVDPGGFWPFNGTRVHSSGRGEHHVYQDILGLGNRVSQEPWGVDVKGVGGMVIGPGSYHPHGTYSVHKDTTPIPPPTELINALVTPSPAQSDQPVEVLEQLDAFVRLAGVYRRMEETPHGQRNNTLNTLAGAAAGIWVRLAPEDQIGEFDEGHIKQKLLDSVPDDTDVPLSTRTINSGWEWGVEHPITDQDVVLPTDGMHLFEETNTLRAIRQAAHSIGRNPFGMLGAVLASVSAELPPWVMLPGVKEGATGSPGSLNVAVALTGPTGSGKTVLSELAQSFLGVDQGPIQRTPSSGQGLIASFLQWDSALKEMVLVNDPRRLFNIDEIDNLGALQSKAESTLSTTIKSMISGSQIGTENADAQRRRNLVSRSYRMALVVGVQPRLSWELLRGEDSGFPQRFLWPAVLDENAPAPDAWPPMPESLNWETPEAIRDRDLLTDSTEPFIIDYPHWLKNEVKWANWEQREADGIDSHSVLTALKVAALLAVLHGEVDFYDRRWWEMAKVVMAHSRSVIDMCKRELAKRAGEADEAMGRSEARRQLARDDYVADSIADKVGRSVLRVVMKEDTGDGVSWSDVRRKLGRGHRPHIEEAVEKLAGDGEIVVREIEYRGQVGKRIFLK